MKSIRLAAVVALAAITITAGDLPVAAPTPAPAPKPAVTSVGLLQEVLPSWLQIGAQTRVRFENPVGLGFVPDAEDSYLLNRVRLDIGVRPIRQLRFYTQFGDSRAWGYDTRSSLASFQNPLDWRQGYAEYTSNESRGVQLRFGRQEIQFGIGRLVSAPDWSNVGRSFDAARVALYVPGYRADLIAGSVVQVDAHRFDRHKPGEHLYGGYGSLTRWVKAANIQPYLLLKTAMNCVAERGGAGDCNVYTGGFRWEGTVPGRFDYSAEYAGQWGNWSSDRIRATAGAYTFGWRLNASTLKPRLSIDFTHASGDSNAKDGSRGTFDQLYAGNHNLTGITDQAGWRNVRMPKVGFDMNLTPKLKAIVDFREIYLATLQDGFYSGSGTRLLLNRSATSRHVGAETDLVTTYQVSKTMTVGAGLGHMFAGAYLQQAGKGGDYTYPYLMFVNRF